MFARLIETVFGCWHRNLSFPRTAKSGARRNPAAFLTGTYVVCLDCGKEFAYDWREMKVIEGMPKTKPAVIDLATKHAA
jgi:predicted protein tyrosine phosphatase